MLEIREAFETFLRFVAGGERKIDERSCQALEPPPNKWESYQQASREQQEEVWGTAYRGKKPYYCIIPIKKKKNVSN